MKSDLLKQRRYIECACFDHRDLFIFDFDDDEFWPGVWVYYTSNRYTTFWERLKEATKFVFLKESFQHGNSVWFNWENINQLDELASELKNFYKNKETKK